MEKPMVFPKISLWGILKYLGRELGLPVALFSGAGALLGAFVYAFLAILMGLWLLGWLVTSPHGWIEFIGWAIILIAALPYTLLGSIAGFVYFGSTRVLLALTNMEEKIHECIDPMIDAILSEVEFGRDGIPFDRFTDSIESVISKLEQNVKRGKRGFFSIGAWIVKRCMSLVIRFLRFLLEDRLLKELKDQGHDAINLDLARRVSQKALIGAIKLYLDNLIRAWKRLVLSISSLILFLPLTIYILFEKVF